MGRVRWFARREIVGTALSLVSVVVLLVLHYTAALHAFGLHDVLRRLFYIPVITAAIAAGLRGGLLTAVVAAVGYLPHLDQLTRAGDRGLDHAIELMLLPLVGLLVGGFADSSRRARALAAERGRLAAVGEVGIAIMAQAEGPLAAIEGHAESLAVQGIREHDASLGFTARIIREEAARARRFLTDLRGLGRSGARRARRVELSPLLFSVVREIKAAAGEQRLRLIGLVEGAPVDADGAVLAFSLRSLVVGLLESVPAPGGLELDLRDEGSGRLVVEAVAFSAHGPLPDLEDNLARVFGARVSEYRFRRALCLHLLAAEGAAIEFRRYSEERAGVCLRFQRAEERSRSRARRGRAALSRSARPHSPSPVTRVS